MTPHLPLSWISFPSINTLFLLFGIELYLRYVAELCCEYQMTLYDIMTKITKRKHHKLHSKHVAYWEIFFGLPEQTEVTNEGKLKPWNHFSPQTLNPWLHSKWKKTQQASWRQWRLTLDHEKYWNSVIFHRFDSFQFWNTSFLGIQNCTFYNL